MTRTLLLDGDINAYQIAASLERPINWGDGLWTLHSEANVGCDRLDSQLAGLVEQLEADEIVVALSGTGNFRMDVLPTYKSNRKETRKPLCLPAMRQHLIDNYETRMFDGLEGDDVLGIMATANFIKGEKIIVSIDKDMKTIPCLYYRTSHRAEGVMEATEPEANWWHMQQTIVGDTTDGYKGCPGAGAVKAQKTLDPFTTYDDDGEITGFDQAGAWAAVVEAYTKAKLGEGEAIIQARCARILRASDFNFKTKEPLLWTPPT